MWFAIGKRKELGAQSTDDSISTASFPQSGELLGMI
jgi:hypothetical protein